MEKRAFKILNIKIAFLLIFVFPVWLICINTSRISFYCILGAIVFMIATWKVYDDVSDIKNGRIILNCLRGALILCIAGLYLPSIVICNFDHTKCMYNLKWLNYAHGLYGFSGERLEHYKRLFPEKLPDECDDYEYLTTGWLAHRYPGSRLMFRTDEETIDMYEEYYAGFCERKYNGALCDDISMEEEFEETEFRLDGFLSNSGLVDRWGEGEDKWREEFENAVIYSTGYFREEVLLDKDSGYVVITIDEPK